jgi:hypothetical protein
MTTLMKAHGHWANRAEDERFSSVEEMHKWARQYKAEAREAALSSPRQLQLGVRGEGKDQSLDQRLVLEGREGQVADLTHWSFGQICREASAPSAYLRTLPVPLARDCLASGLKGAEDREVRLLLNHNGHNTLRAITSPKYCRIWNSDVTQRLVELKHSGQGWQEAPAAFDGSRGQYLSDRDMFSFFVDNDRRIFEKGPGGGLSRGFFAWNSEVGASTFGIMTFLYEYVCGNHRVWGASEVVEVKIRHVGRADEKGFEELSAAVKMYADSSASEDEAKILLAREYRIGQTKDEVLDRLFGLGLATRKVLEEAHGIALEHEDWYGDPLSAWGMGGGLTQVARDLPNADERVALDRAGAKVLELAW